MDVGQIVISGLLSLLAIIGYFIKKDITTFARRLDKHDEIILNLTGNVQRLIGFYEATRGRRRLGDEE